MINYTKLNKGANTENKKITGKHRASVMPNFVLLFESHAIFSKKIGRILLKNTQKRH